MRAPRPPQFKIAFAAPENPQKRHVYLQEMKEEAETNKKIKKENDLKKNKSKVDERYTVEEYFDESEDEEDEDSEPEWGQTPLIRRIKKIREKTLSKNPKRKLGETFDTDDSRHSQDENQPPKPKRSTSLAGMNKNSIEGQKIL